MLARMSLPRGQLAVDKVGVAHPYREQIAPNGSEMCALKLLSSIRRSDAGNQSKSAITSSQVEV